jgi:hypothetical protein
MKRRVGKEPEGGSKKRKQVGNDNSLASMFAKQQAASDLKKQKKNTMHSFRKEKKFNSAKTQCGPKLQKHLIPDAACEMSVQ